MGLYGYRLYGAIITCYRLYGATWLYRLYGATWLYRLYGAIGYNLLGYIGLHLRGATIGNDELGRLNSDNSHLHPSE